MGRKSSAPISDCKKVVTVFQEWIPDYRVSFFDKLHDAFESKNVTLKLVAGKPTSKYLGRPEAKQKPKYLSFSNRFDFNVGQKRFSWTPIRKELRSSDLIIFEQARRNLEIYPLLLFRTKRSRVKIVLWGHGHDHKPVSSLSRALLRFVTSKADAIFIYKFNKKIFHSQPAKELRYEIGNSLYTKLEIENIRKSAIDSKNSKLILFLGAVSQDKKIFEFLELAQSALRLKVDWEFVIAGAGPELSEIDSNLFSNLRLAGTVSGAKKSQLISSAMCLVIPDAIGLVAVDAIVHEKIVFTNIAARNHGPEYVYLEEAGLVKKYSGMDDLVSQLNLLMEESSTTRSLINAPTLEDVIDNFVQACLDLLGRTG